MYLKEEYASRLEKDPGLRQELATAIGVTPLTIKRAIPKNKEKKKSKLTSRLALKWLSKHFKIDEVKLTAIEIIVSDGNEEQEPATTQLNG